MGVQTDFIIESFKSRKHDFRTDKGKKPNYPKFRRCWNSSSHRQNKPNLSKYATTADNIFMDKEKKFKNPAEIR